MWRLVTGRDWQENISVIAAFRSWRKQTAWLRETRKARDVAMFKWLNAAKHWEMLCVRRLFLRWMNARRHKLNLLLARWMRWSVSSAFAVWRGILTRARRLLQSAVVHHSGRLMRGSFCCWRIQVKQQCLEQRHGMEATSFLAQRLCSLAWKAWISAAFIARDHHSCATMHAEHTQVRRCWKHWRVAAPQLRYERQSYAGLSERVAARSLRWGLAHWKDRVQCKQLRLTGLRIAISQWQGKTLHATFGSWRALATRQKRNRRACEALLSPLSKVLKRQAYQAWASWRQARSNKQCILAQVSAFIRNDLFHLPAPDTRL
jgi:hypothetical protein